MKSSYIMICGIALLVSSVRAGEEEIKYPVIARVTTWKALQQVEPIDLGGGVRIRLGLEELKCPVNAGVLLYCATEGFQPRESWSRADLVGPVIISSSQQYLRSITSNDGMFAFGFGFEAHRPQAAGLDKCKLLFMHPLFAVKAGDLEVRIRAFQEDDDPKDDEDGDPPGLLAVGKIKCTEDDFHPWMPWEPLDDFGDERPEKIPVGNYGNGIVLPYVMPMRASVMHGTVDGKAIESKPDEPLPKLLPAKPTPGFRISEADGILTLRSEAGFDVWGPGSLVITRWWVNGEPRIPVQLPPDDRYGGAGWSLEGDKPSNQMKVRLVLDLEKLMAKKGDRIGLQLLHCDDGWAWVAEGRTSIPKGWERSVMPEMSNRIEFTAK